VRKKTSGGMGELVDEIGKSWKKKRRAGCEDKNLSRKCTQELGAWEEAESSRPGGREKWGRYRAKKGVMGTKHYPCLWLAGRGVQRREEEADKKREVLRTK